MPRARGCVTPLEHASKLIAVLYIITMCSLAGSVVTLAALISVMIVLYICKYKPGRPTACRQWRMVHIVT